MRNLGVIRFLVGLILMVSGQFALANTCENVFKPGERDFVRRPWRSIKNPKEQYRQYGVLVTRLAPRFTNEQVERIRAVTSRKENVFGIFISRDVLTSAQIAAIPADMREGANKDRLHMATVFGQDVLDRLHDYVSELELLMGLPAEHLLLRDETSSSVPEGHVHRGGITDAVASVAVEGLGTFVDVDGERYVPAAGQTVIFRDGKDPIFHGTPLLDGRRLFVGVVFHSARWQSFNKQGFRPGAAVPFPNAK